MRKIATIALALLIATPAQAFDGVVTFQRSDPTPAQAAPIAAQLSAFGDCPSVALYSAQDVAAIDCVNFWFVSTSAGGVWIVPTEGLEDALSSVYDQPAKIVETTDSSFTIHLP